jgi:hypothetical protein
VVHDKQFLCGVKEAIIFIALSCRICADRQKLPSTLHPFPPTISSSDSRQAIKLIAVPTMNGFWKELERRTSASSYGYELGDEAKPEHIDLKKPLDPHEQEIGDNVFVKRSNGTWGFAVLTEKGTDGGGNFCTYQIGRNHKFKTLREDQLSECVKAVEAERQRRKFGTDFSLSYDSGYINKEYGFSEKYELGDEAKSEHIDHTKTNHYAAYEARKLRVGDNCFVKRSNGTWCFAVLTEKTTDRDGCFYTYQIDRNNKFKTLHEDQLGESVRVVEKSSSPKLDVDQSLSCESYTDRVAQSNQKQLREGIIKNDSEDKENICHSNKSDRLVADEDESRQSRSSKKAAPSKHHKGKRRRTTTDSKPLSLPPAALNAIEEQHEEDFSILEDLKNTEALISKEEEPSNNFNEKAWRGKSDPEILFMPSGEEKNSTSTAIVPYSQDPTQSIAEEKSSPGEPNHSSHRKKRRRVVFGKFFARKFRKKEASDESQCNAVNSTNDIGEVADATSQSDYEKVKPLEKPPESVAQHTSSQYRYHYSTKPTRTYAAPAGLVPIVMNQHAHYISAPKLAQAYRDYAKTCPQGYYLYNPITRNAQYVNQWMPNYQPVPHFCHGMQSGMPSLQPNTQNNVIYVGKNGVQAASGHGVQIYPGTNITRIDL